MSHALKYGDNVDTDVIIPARYLNTTDRAILAQHAMEDIDPRFLSKLNRGDVLVAGRNFGCGSSREHAPIVLKECGVSCIIAKSFARIFYRNALNIGLAIIESTEAAEEILEGDTIVVDVAGGLITNETQGGKTYHVAPFPEFLQEIITAGGLIEVARQGKLT